MVRCRAAQRSCALESMLVARPIGVPINYLWGDGFGDRAVSDAAFVARDIRELLLR